MFIFIFPSDFMPGDIHPHGDIGEEKQNQKYWR